MATVDGGEQRQARWLGRLDLDLDSGRGLFGLDDAHAHADIMLLHGGGLSARDVGDAQVVSNIDAPYALRVFELFVEARLGGGVRAKAGYIDLNSEFDVQGVGALFLNSSFGIAPDFSQSGQNGPSIFPVTAPGLVVALERARWTLRGAVFDADAGDPVHPHRFLPGPPGRDGALVAIEGDAKVGDGGEVQAGAWAYSDRVDRIDGPGSGRSAGAYLQYEQTLAGNEAQGRLRGWVRGGVATQHVNAIGTYVGGGLTWGTERQTFGIAVAHARLGDPGLRAVRLDVGQGHRAETAIELTAHRRVSDWLIVQPDAQWVRHPSWGGTRDALVLGLRFKFSTR